MIAWRGNGSTRGGHHRPNPDYRCPQNPAVIFYLKNFKQNFFLFKNNFFRYPGGRLGLSHDGLKWFVWVYGCIPDLAFCLFLVLSFGNSVRWVLHFFLCCFFLFYVFTIRNSSLLIVAFFCCCDYGRTVLLFLSLFLCSFVVKSALGT